MSSPADPFSILNRGQNPPGFKKPEPKPKVLRYRKGKGPEHEEPEDDDNDDIYPISHYTVDNSDKASVAESQFTSKNEDEELNERLKKRRQRQRTVIVEENRPEQEEQSRTQENKMAIEPASEEKADQEEEVVDIRRRRALLKEKLLEQEKINEEIDNNRELDEDAMEEEIENIDEEEETGEGIISMLKPVFVSKHERESNDKRIEEEIALREEENKLKEKRKLEAKMLLIEATRKEEAENDENLSAGEMPNDDDDIDEANQYEQWKIRELKRIKREKEERFKKDKEKAEIERRRRLTDAERAHENKVLGSDDTLKPEKVQYKFMQRYYHKGGFYQDSDDPIFQRDYNVAVGPDDLRDKSMLPKILQVRGDQFGKKGRSKYTHLTDQDTTNFDPKHRVDETIQEKNKMRLGGYKGQNVFDRSSRKK